MTEPHPAHLSMAPLGQRTLQATARTQSPDVSRPEPSAGPPDTVGSTPVRKVPEQQRPSVPGTERRWLFLFSLTPGSGKADHAWHRCPRVWVPALAPPWGLSVPLLSGLEGRRPWKDGHGQRGLFAVDFFCKGWAHTFCLTSMLGVTAWPRLAAGRLGNGATPPTAGPMTSPACVSGTPRRVRMGSDTTQRGKAGRDGAGTCVH